MPLHSDNMHNFKRKRYICKPCWATRQARYNAAKPRIRSRHVETADAIYTRRLRNFYGITPADYERILEKQGGGCAICHGGTNGRGRFHVDHCHTTGIVRGLLCAKCNLLLGHADDDTRRLRAAIAYLIDPPAC